MSAPSEPDTADDPPPDGLHVEMHEREVSDALARSVSSGAAPTDPDENAELDAHIDAMVNRFVAPPAEVRPSILQLLNRRRVDSLVISDYDGAELQDKYRSILAYTLKLEAERMNADHRLGQLYQRWLQLLQDEDSINSKWDEKMSSFSQEDQQKYDEMCETHEKEMAAFDTFWRDPINLRPFTKPSRRLLDLRKQEKAMGVARLYQRAKDMKQFADKVQRDETAAAQARIVQRMSIDRDKLLANQEQDRNRHLVHRRGVLMSMEYERGEQLRPVLTALSQLRAKRSGPRPPQAAVSRPGADETGQTPRTQRRYAAYRAEESVPRLEVQPVENAPPTRTAGSRRSTTAGTLGTAETAAAAEGETEREVEPEEAATLPHVISDTLEQVPEPPAEG